MNSKPVVSAQTRRNWLIDIGLLMSALLAAISGIYFLFIPSGGFQGGRNPYYGITVLFSRQTWDWIHTWMGVVMILIIAVHLPLHWSWVVNIARRTWRELTGQCGCMNPRGRFNVLVNLLIAVSFLITALSGIYFLYNPHGRNLVDSAWIFTRQTWDTLHTWSGVILILAAALHFAIHWKWVTKVGIKLMRGLTSKMQPSGIDRGLNPEALP